MGELPKPAHERKSICYKRMHKKKYENYKLNSDDEVCQPRQSLTALTTGA